MVKEILFMKQKVNHKTISFIVRWWDMLIISITLFHKKVKTSRRVMLTMAAMGVDPKAFDGKLITAKLLNLTMVRGGFLSDVNKLTQTLLNIVLTWIHWWNHIEQKLILIKTKDGWKRKNDEKYKACSRKT